MPALKLTIAERKAHRAEAHHLAPVVMIGNDGLTPAIKKETDAALNAHGLIKIRVLGDDRTTRESIYNELCEELEAAPIQHIGKLLVLWRPKVDKEKTVDEERKGGAAPREFKVLKYSKRGGQRPEVKTLRVLGNQRLTSGGQVRRAKPPKQKSIKKGRQT
ncbi:YhbY family RNA-binding protein [Caenimonas sp. SL110]|uniref:YhbY family RNA-binding protein n=1 Tax=Caenimonas sp. SL110 TaxID=1450524 RepID=UPI000653E147|nr:YhbY family RNA-binding protein [Caenimonas sp. SL110]